MLSNGIYSMPGMCSVLAFFPLSLSLCFCVCDELKNAHNGTNYNYGVFGLTVVQQEKGNRKLQEAIRASAVIHL